MLILGALWDSLPKIIIVSEIEIIISLQSLLNKTVERFLQVFINGDFEIFHYYGTTGFDRSPGHINPNQKTADPALKSTAASKSLFITNLLTHSLEADNEDWTNPLPRGTSSAEH